MVETAAIGFVGGRDTIRTDGSRSKIWHCTVLFPMPSRYGYQSIHPEAERIGLERDKYGWVKIYLCPHCGTTIKRGVDDGA